MGQRLNIEIVDADLNVLANAYYHWSAYTGSAIALTEEIIALYDEYMDMDSGNNPFDKRDLAIRLLESTGAGVNKVEKTRIKNSPELCKYAIQDCQDRNRGLLAITDEGIEETERWEEARVTVNIDAEVVEFSVHWEDTFDEWLENYSGGEDTEEAMNVYKNLEEIDLDPSIHKFNEFWDLADTYRRTSDAFGYRRPDGSVVSWIA